MALVFVCILNFAVRSGRCICPEQFVDTEHMLGSDRTRTDINGEQKRSADDMRGGGNYMAIEWVGSTIECEQFLLKLRVKI